MNAVLRIGNKTLCESIALNIQPCTFLHPPARHCLLRRSGVSVRETISGGEIPPVPRPKRVRLGPLAATLRDSIQVTSPVLLYMALLLIGDAGKVMILEQGHRCALRL